MVLGAGPPCLDTDALAVFETCEAPIWDVCFEQRTPLPDTLPAARSEQPVRAM